MAVDGGVHALGCGGAGGGFGEAGLFVWVRGVFEGGGAGGGKLGLVEERDVSFEGGKVLGWEVVGGRGIAGVRLFGRSVGGGRRGVVVGCRASGWV